MPAASAKTPRTSRAATTVPQQRKASPVSNWSALLDTATVEDKGAKRTSVEVPTEVFDWVKMLQTSGKVATVPVRDKAHFDELKPIFQSAADKLDNASAIVREKKVEVQEEVDGETVTVSRVVGATVSIGKRRGASK